jgi:hypothetical protein
VTALPAQSSWQRLSRGFHRFPLLVATIPLLAGVYEAYAAANAFFSELLLRLPLALFMAFVVYCLVSVVGAVLLRLNRASVAAQAARRTMPSLIRSHELRL